MSNESDMAAPVTRADLAATIAATEGRLRGEIVAARNELAATEQSLRGEIGASEGRLRGEIVAMRDQLARHANAMMEHIQTLVTVVEEKYRSLPDRVKRLEEFVFAPKPKRPRRAAR
jgi:hypothetical protein